MIGEEGPAAVEAPVEKAACALAADGIEGEIEAGDGSGAPAKSAKSNGCC